MSCVEHRVRVDFYGSLPGDSPLLVPIPTAAGYPQQRLHVLAAKALGPMSDAVYKDLGFPLEAASGWRPHRWPSWEYYVVFVTKKYGSLERGRIYLGFDSPHETSLAVDFACGGLRPDSSTIEKQKNTPLYKWLMEHADKYGFSCYKPESWHFEYWIDQDSYKSGVITKPCIYTPSPAPINDVCEDGSCFTTPLLDDGSSLVCK